MPKKSDIIRVAKNNTRPKNRTAVANHEAYPYMVTRNGKIQTFHETKANATKKAKKERASQKAYNIRFSK